MTCLEHLIENTLCSFEKGKSSEDIHKQIKEDINLEYSGITADQCWEIYQYMWYTFIYARDEKLQSETAQKVYNSFGFDVDGVLEELGANIRK